MSQIIRKKCNGKEKHDNDFTRDDLLRKAPVVRIAPAPPAAADVPNELVCRCRTCTDGRVVFTRSELGKVAGTERGA
ncbi:MAG: hypothetical protein HY011_06025 [Acidobacteria bacterium]|nr:hypothetical protein [Acidobacteriota bacterium]